MGAVAADGHDGAVAGENQVDVLVAAGGDDPGAQGTGQGGDAGVLAFRGHEHFVGEALGHGDQGAQYQVVQPAVDDDGAAVMEFPSRPRFPEGRLAGQRLTRGKYRAHAVHSGLRRSRGMSARSSGWTKEREAIFTMERLL